MSDSNPGVTDHEIQGEMILWDPNTQPEMDLSQLICVRPELCPGT